MLGDIGPDCRVSVSDFPKWSAFRLKQKRTDGNIILREKRRVKIPTGFHY